MRPTKSSAETTETQDQSQHSASQRDIEGPLTIRVPELNTEVLVGANLVVGDEQEGGLLPDGVEILLDDASAEELRGGNRVSAALDVPTRKRRIGGERKERRKV